MTPKPEKLPRNLKKWASNQPKLTKNDENDVYIPGNHQNCLSNYRPLRAATGFDEFLVVEPHASGVARPSCGSPLTRKTAFFGFFRVFFIFLAWFTLETEENTKSLRENAFFRVSTGNLQNLYKNLLWIFGGGVHLRVSRWVYEKNLSNQGNNNVFSFLWIQLTMTR
jgi:hypothetical protein